MINKIISFLNITDKTIWQGVILSSLLIPIIFTIFEKIKKWISNSRPAKLLLKGYKNTEIEIFIFLSQLSALDNLEQKNLSQKYGAFYPTPTPTDKNKLGIHMYQNIDPVWAESDGRCTADVFNVLGAVGKTKNIKIADTLKDWNKHRNPMFSIGFNPKTKDILNECNPIYFNGYNEKYLAIKGNSIQLDSNYPNDAGILQKTFIKNTSIPIFILAGLGTVGTEVPGYFLSQKYIELGKLYANKAFCILLKTDITKGRNYFEVKAIYPNPTWWRAILYPITFFNWFKKNLI